MQRTVHILLGGDPATMTTAECARRARERYLTIFALQYGGGGKCHTAAAFGSTAAVNVTGYAVLPAFCLVAAFCRLLVSCQANYVHAWKATCCSYHFRLLLLAVLLCASCCPAECFGCKWHRALCVCLAVAWVPWLLAAGQWRVKPRRSNALQPANNFQHNSQQLCSTGLLLYLHVQLCPAASKPVQLNAAMCGLPQLTIGGGPQVLARLTTTFATCRAEVQLRSAVADPMQTCELHTCLIQ